METSTPLPNVFSTFEEDMSKPYMCHRFDSQEACEATEKQEACLDWIEEALQELISDLKPLNNGNLDELSLDCTSSQSESQADDRFFMTTTELMALDGCCLDLPMASSSTYNRPERQEQSLPQPTGDLQNLTDTEIMEMSVREFKNKLLVGRPKEKVTEIRHRRRCLKNREYANNSRRKKEQAKEGLESSVMRLQKELSRMRIELEKTEKERDLYKKQFYIEQNLDMAVDVNIAHEL